MNQSHWQIRTCNKLKYLTKTHCCDIYIFITVTDEMIQNCLLSPYILMKKRVQNSSHYNLLNYHKKD